MTARALLVVALLALCAGLWGGSAWRSGRVAVAQNKALKAQQKADRQAIEDLREAANRLRQHAVDASLAYEQASERMGAIAQQLETDREANRRFEQAQRADLARLLAARPDLRGVRVGADLLRHWQASNAGAAGDAAPAPAGTAGQPARPVPAAADGRK